MTDEMEFKVQGSTNYEIDDIRRDLRWVATMDPQTDSKLLERLAAQEAPGALLERIAEHPNASVALLRKLSCHPNHEIRCAVTENPSTLETIILALAADDHPDVRFRIAENHNTPGSALKLLVEDENPYVSERAKKTLRRIEGVTSGSLPAKSGGVGIELAQHEVELQAPPPPSPFEAKAKTKMYSAPEQPAEPRRVKLKVLVIEDNPADVRLLEKALAKWPFELQCADRLSTGLEYLARGSFDVVLLDLSLPDAQGIETFYLVHCQAPHVPVVVLTGLEDESVGSEAVQLGAQDYLVKGQVLPGLLARAIKYAVERHESETMIRDLNQSLERRVLQLAAANQDLERLTQAMADSSAQARDLLDRLARVMYKEGHEPSSHNPSPARPGTSVFATEDDATVAYESESDDRTAAPQRSGQRVKVCKRTTSHE